MERNSAKREGSVARLNSDKLVCIMVYSRAYDVAPTYQQRIARV